MKVLLICLFYHFLDFRADICQIFRWFFGKFMTKDILKLTDLQAIAIRKEQLYWHVEVVQGCVRGGDCLLLHHRHSLRQKYINKIFTQN